MESPCVKQYAVSRFSYGLFTVAMPVFFVAVGSFSLYAALTTPERRAPLWFVTVWLAAVMVGSFQSLKLPFRIEVTEDGRIQFVSLLGRVSMWPRDIISIKQKTLRMGFIEVRHNRGKIQLLNQFTGFHDFLNEVKRANPSVEIIGC